MAVTPINTIKSWFETADKPTQEQFWNWIDSFFHKSAGIAINNVTGLEAVLNGLLPTVSFDAFEQGALVAMDAPYTYTIPAGYLLEKIIPYYGEAAYMQISAGVMGDTDIADIPEVDAGWNRPIVLDVFAEADTDIYINGIPEGSKIVFIKRKIKTA